MRFPWAFLLKTLGDQFSNRSAPSVDGEICAVEAVIVIAILH